MYVIRCSDCRNTQIEITEDVALFLKKHNSRIEVIETPFTSENILATFGGK